MLGPRGIRAYRSTWEQFSRIDVTVDRTAVEISTVFAVSATFILGMRTSPRALSSPILRTARRALEATGRLLSRSVRMYLRVVPLRPAQNRSQLARLKDYFTPSSMCGLDLSDPAAQNSGKWCR